MELLVKSLRQQCGAFCAALVLLAPASACSPNGGTGRTGSNGATGTGGGAGSGGQAAASGSGGTAGAGSGGVSTGGASGGAAATGGGVSGAGGSTGGDGSVGGASGSGATGGTAGTGTGGGGDGGTGGTSPIAVVSDDFESGTVGMAPDPSRWEAFTDLGTGTVAITDEDAHSGTLAVKVVAGGNPNDHAFLVNTTAFPLPAGVVHFRVWMKYTDANWQNHVTFIESIGAGDQTPEIRLGGQAGYYHANLSTDDGLSPDPFVPCAICQAPVANQWTCVQGMFDSMTSRVQAWIDGALAVDADEPGDWHNGGGNPEAGMLPMMLQRIGFGWESYGAIGNTVYYDDVAIGYEPIGCE